ncbi:TPA: DUF551 domain-containing protein [Escherichia coli]|nr:DUF551 domain-containing protein [Escherichia coli]HBV2761174.1 DUF551 domain-containing protein [Escherichia coli]
MSTITKELAKLFRKITNSEIDAEGNAHVVLSPADSLLINNARIALASLEAEPVAWAHRLINKRNGVVHPWVYGSAEACPSEGDIFNIEVMPLYTAPPAPVAVPECFKRLLHHAYGMTMGHDWNKGTMAGHHRAKLCQAVDECRAAMLQGADGTLTNEGTMQLSGNSEQIEPVSNRDELPLDYLQGHKDGLEWAAQLAEANHPQTGYWLYDDPIDLARAIRKGPDMPTVQGGNYPVTPDGWISCSERMPENGQNVLISVNFDSSLVEPLICSARYTGSTFRRGDATIKPGNDIEQATHWMPLPEPPQEVNRG